MAETRVAPKRVGIFGSSLNPPTVAHCSIIRHLLEEGLDELIVLPVYQHIFNTKRNLAPFDVRLDLIRGALRDTLDEEALAKVQVSELEKTLCLEFEAKEIKERVGTWDVVTRLREERPDVNLVLVLGGDTFEDLAAAKWKHSADLLYSMEIIVIQRGHHAAPPEIPDGALVKTTRLQSCTGLVSSTNVRECCASKNYQQLELLVTPYVKHRLEAVGLYTKDLAPDVDETNTKERITLEDSTQPSSDATPTPPETAFKDVIGNP